MKKVIKLFLVSLILLVLGCSEDVVPDPPEYYHIFTGANKKTWRISKIVWTGEGKGDVTLSIAQSCYRDDSYIFYANKDNQFEVTGGNIKCGAGESSIVVSDNWSFINATATLNIIIPLLSDNTLPFYVIKASTKEMTLEIYLDQDNTYSYQITMQSISEE